MLFFFLGDERRRRAAAEPSFWSTLQLAAAIRPDCHLSKPWKTEITCDISTRQIKAFIRFPSLLTVPHTQHWPFSLNWVIRSGKRRLWKNNFLSVCCWFIFFFFSENTKELTRPFIYRSSARKKASQPDVFYLSSFLFFFLEALSEPGIPLSAFH